MATQGLYLSGQFGFYSVRPNEWPNDLCVASALKKAVRSSNIKPAVHLSNSQISHDRYIYSIYQDAYFVVLRIFGLKRGIFEKNSDKKRLFMGEKE